MASGNFDAPVAGPGFTFMVHADEGPAFTARFAVLPRVSAANMVRGGIGYAIQPSTNVVDVTYHGYRSLAGAGDPERGVAGAQNYGADRIRGIANPAGSSTSRTGSRSRARATSRRSRTSSRTRSARTPPIFRPKRPR